MVIAWLYNIFDATNITWPRYAIFKEELKRNKSMNLKFLFYRQMLSVSEIFGQKYDADREGWGWV
jgi:hypothetical protein